MHQNARTEMVLGAAAMERLQDARVAVFGLGGVGGYVLEGLCRVGVGHLHLIDHDRVSLTNLNRQILATRDNLGRKKTEAAADRVRAVNPDIRVRTDEIFVLPETVGAFDFSAYDYVVDAIDTVSGKLALVTSAAAAGTPILSCMGTGNRTDPGRLRIGDIYETSVCHLARVMRKELRKRSIGALKVCYSTEPPLVPAEGAVLAETLREAPERRSVPGSTVFVPAAAGMMIAAAVTEDLLAPLRGEIEGRRQGS